MPSVALVNKYSLESRPHHLALNCNTTLLSVIDVTGLLQFVDLGENKMGLWSVEASHASLSCLQTAPAAATRATC